MQITINVPVVNMARDVMILMQALSITRAIGRGGLADLLTLKHFEGNHNFMYTAGTYLMHFIRLC